MFLSGEMGALRIIVVVSAFKSALELFAEVFVVQLNLRMTTVASM